MKLAVTSQNFRTVTGHAGSTRRFIVYETRDGGGAAETARLDLPREMAFHGFAGGPHPIDGIDVLVTAGAGDGFVAKLAARGIRVVRSGQCDPALAVQEVLLGRVTPPAPDAHDHAGAGDHEGAHEGCGCRCGH